MAALPSSDQFITGDFGGLTSLSGVITATPSYASAGVYALRVPYLLVPRGLSDVSAELKAPFKSSGDVVNAELRFRNDGVHSGYRRHVRPRAHGSAR